MIENMGNTNSAENMPSQESERVREMREKIASQLKRMNHLQQNMAGMNGQEGHDSLPRNLETENDIIERVVIADVFADSPGIERFARHSENSDTFGFSEKTRALANEAAERTLRKWDNLINVAKYSAPALGSLATMASAFQYSQTGSPISQALVAGAITSGILGGGVLHYFQDRIAKNKSESKRNKLEQEAQTLKEVLQSEPDN